MLITFFPRLPKVVKSSTIDTFGGFTVGLVLLTLLAFIVLSWLQIPAGHLVDWLIGVSSFWWLIVLITIPWNIYFQARAVAEEARRSQDQQISIDAAQLGYIDRVVFWRDGSSEILLGGWIAFREVVIAKGTRDRSDRSDPLG